MVMTDNKVFTGSLLFLSLTDVFQMLGSNSCTGRLTLRSPYAADMGIVYFMDGNPVNASWGNLKGLKAVHSLFGWTDGEYAFFPEDLTGMDVVITANIMEIVMDAVRLLDDGEIARIGPVAFDQHDAGKTGADGMEIEVPPVKGPPVDYRYATREKEYADGETIVKEGEHGKWLWVIGEGTVKIIKETSKGPLTIARLGEGCFIGTVGAFLHGEYKRNATVVAEGPVLLCVLDAEALYREYSALSQDFKSFLLSLDYRVRMLNENVMQAYIGGHSRELPKDKVFEPGLHNHPDLYVIKEGTALIIGQVPDGEVELLSLDVGHVFGKIPFLAFGHEPLSASVMISVPFKADILDSKALQKEYEGLSQTLRNFVFTTAANIAMTTNFLYQLLYSEKVFHKTLHIPTQ